MLLLGYIIYFDWLGDFLFLSLLSPVCLRLGIMGGGGRGGMQIEYSTHLLGS